MSSKVGTSPISDPPLQDEPPLRTFRCPESTWASLVEAASNRGTSVDSLLCDAIAHHVLGGPTGDSHVPPSVGTPRSTTAPLGSRGKPEAGPGVEVVSNPGKTQGYVLFPTEAVHPDHATPAGKTEHVFIAHVSEDRKWVDRLRQHLQPLVHAGLLDAWDATKIRPGDVWREEIERALHRARSAIVLVSSAFLASDFIREEMLPRLLDAAKLRGMVLKPLLVSPSAFAGSPLSAYQPFNRAGQELASVKWVECEELLLQVAQNVLPAREPA